MLKHCKREQDFRKGGHTCTCMGYQSPYIIDIYLIIYNASHEILTNVIAGKASPASALMHVCIKSMCIKPLIAPFRVQNMFYCGHSGEANKRLDLNKALLSLTHYVISPFIVPPSCHIKTRIAL